MTTKYKPNAEDQIRHGIEALKAISDLLVNVNGKQLDMVQSENLCGLVQVITEHLEAGVDALGAEAPLTDALSGRTTRSLRTAGVL